LLVATNIEAVVFDLDGTAIQAAELAMPSVVMIDAIAQARPQLRLSAATGRSWDVAAPVIRALGLTDACVIGGGTQVIGPVSAELLWQAQLDSEATQVVADIIISHGCDFAYTRGLVTTDNLGMFSPEGINVMYLLNVEQYKVPAIINELTFASNISVSNLLSWKSPELIDVHITPNTATKEHAVRELATMIGVPTSRMAGVGDGANDLHLFNAVSHKVAMGNAVPELKAAADEVIASVGEDGLAHYINYVAKQRSVEN
jgi:hydroxymethylpyrimidine pyrophosphatase-like HAD family hydrolase